MTDDAPLLRVVRGEPTAEEVAALVTVLATRAAGTGARAPKSTSRWAEPARRVRDPLRHGPDAWRWAQR